MEDPASSANPINLIVVDTNILLSDTLAINELIKENHLSIPYKVIEELEGLKTSRDAGWLARNNLRKIGILEELKDLIRKKKLEEEKRLAEKKDSVGLTKQTSPEIAVIDFDHPQLKKDVKSEKSVNPEEEEFLFTIDEASRFSVHYHENYTDLKWLNPKVSDHKILATFNSLVRFHTQNNKKPSPVRTKNKNHQTSSESSSPSQVVFQKIKLITNDQAMIILARELSRKYDDRVSIESYRRNRAKPKLDSIKKVVVKNDWSINLAINARFPIPSSLNYLKENDGVLLTRGQHTCLAMRQGSNLLILDPEKSIAGIKAFVLNGFGYNWPQVLAINQLLNRKIECVFLQGGAGTGKTLLALAAAIAQRDIYRKILVIRPMIPLSDKDRMGFLPGPISDKTGPWLRPIEYNLDFIDQAIKKNKIDLPEKKEVTFISAREKKRLRKNGGSNNGQDEQSEFTLFEKYNIEVFPLDYIRGTTLTNTCLIVDEAQNLTSLQIKTVITRAGFGSKFIFTGDISQIDVEYLNEESSGMSHAIVKMHDKTEGAGDSLVATTIFTDSLRSELAALAIERFRDRYL